MLRAPISLAVFFVLAAVDVSGGQATARRDSAATRRTTHSGTWSAATGGGIPFAGTWTATADATHRTVIGTWTLVDAQRKPIANGNWSASKSADKWSGAWRANVADRPGEYTGTWTASAELKASGSFADLFEKAARTMVSGTWRAGAYSGPGSIRATK
jgi:hypothetical protein